MFNGFLKLLLRLLHFWTQVDVVKSRDYVDMSNYVTNGEWSFVGTTIVRNEVQYPIGPAVYPDVTVYVTMRRRILYYMLNIIPTNFKCLGHNWCDTANIIPPYLNNALSFYRNLSTSFV